MCLAVAGEISCVDENFALASTKGITQRVNVSLVTPVYEGDYVLIHAGFAIEKIDKDYFDFLDNIISDILKDDSYGSLQTDFKNK